MTQTTIEDNEFATLWFHPEKKIIHHEFKKFIHGEVLHTFLLKGTETMKKYKATKWLSDDRKIPVLKSEDSKWGQEIWFPQTIQAGWKYWALVTPTAVIGKVTMENLLKIYAQAGVTAKYFDTPEEALKWLESV
jgi:hypothetical protein